MPTESANGINTLNGTVMDQDNDGKNVLAGGISIHAVDVANGIPANGLAVSLFFLGDTEMEIASGACDASGLLQHLVSEGQGVRRGMYRVEFSVGDYFRSLGADLPDPAFMETAIFHFGIDKVKEHFHLPFKFTAWGYSLFRGGA